MIDVTVLVLEGGLPSTYVVPLEILTAAGTLLPALTGRPAEPRFRVRTASVDGKKMRTGVPLEVQASLRLEDVRRTDLVIVPAVGMDLAAMVRKHARVVDWLRRRGRTTAVAAVCTGASLLAATGLLDGRPATTHWALAERSRELFPAVQWKPDRLITESGNLFCGGGVYAAIDLSLYLVERFAGHEIAAETARTLLLERPRVWQMPYALEPPSSAHDDEQVRRAQKWIYDHHAEVVDLGAVARRAGMSPRHFARRFKAASGEAPLTYLHRLRISRARHLLESASRSIEEISRQVGYEDVAFFRQLFRRHTGTSPREYRARFGPRLAS